MAEETSAWTWAARIPVALILAILSAIVFFVQLDTDRKHLAAKVIKIEAKQAFRRTDEGHRHEAQAHRTVSGQDTGTTHGSQQTMNLICK